MVVTFVKISQDFGLIPRRDFTDGRLLQLTRPKIQMQQAMAYPYKITKGWRSRSICGKKTKEDRGMDSNTNFYAIFSSE